MVHRITLNMNGKHYMAPPDPNTDRTADYLSSVYVLGDWLVEPSLNRITNEAGTQQLSPRNMKVLGSTYAFDFPTTVGAYNRFSNGDADCFLAILSSDLSSLNAATYVGGSRYDRPSSMVQGVGGEIYFGGYSMSPNFPVLPGAFDNMFNGSSEAIVCCLSADLTNLTASTMLGVYGAEYGSGLFIHEDGSIFTSGSTEDSNFPVTPDVFDEDCNGDFDIYIAHLDAQLETLLEATFLGGSVDEWNDMI